MKRCNLVYKIFADYILNKYCIIIYIILSLIIMKYDMYASILLLILIIVPFKLSIKELFDTDTIPNITPSITSLQNSINSEDLINAQFLGIDSRFKKDDVVIQNILRQIKSQVDFDPYKTDLSKDVINEIYNKYFDNDIFVKLKNNNDDSKDYLAAGNFNYVPKVAQADYDLVSYQNLSDNLQIGINPIIDGINNKTKINRG
jgi:hypothetical protein